MRVGGDAWPPQVPSTDGGLDHEARGGGRGGGCEGRDLGPKSKVLLPQGCDLLLGPLAVLAERRDQVLEAFRHLSGEARGDGCGVHVSVGSLADPFRVVHQRRRGRSKRVRPGRGQQGLELAEQSLHPRRGLRELLRCCGNALPDDLLHAAADALHELHLNIDHQLRRALLHAPRPSLGLLRGLRNDPHPRLQRPRLRPRRFEGEYPLCGLDLLHWNLGALGLVQRRTNRTDVVILDGLAVGLAAAVGLADGGAVRCTRSALKTASLLGRAAFAAVSPRRVVATRGRRLHRASAPRRGRSPTPRRATRRGSRRGRGGARRGGGARR
mmetsp:Transcript_49096/g.141146  ORF Transcript_49096/g.141146 Transcript_49096/m.141146 type:complete len:326 (-) Transcript_49096:388-1365(-)